MEKLYSFCLHCCCFTDDQDPPSSNASRLFVRFHQTVYPLDALCRLLRTWVSSDAMVEGLGQMTSHKYNYIVNGAFGHETLSL